MSKYRPCPICKTPFAPARLAQAVCSPKCAIEFNKPKQIKARIKEYRPQTEKLSDLRKRARDLFQKWIRQRDAKLPCISCDKEVAQQFDGGHYLKAELYTGLIFDEDNCHKQCSYCNDYLKGNVIEYRKRLINRIGLCKVEDLEARADKSRVYKFSRLELLGIADTYRDRLKELKEMANVGQPINVTR